MIRTPGYGAIYLNAMGISPIIQHTTIRDNSTQAIRQYSPNMAPFYHDLTFSGNGSDDIGIYQFTGTGVSTGRSWDFSTANVPVRLYSNVVIYTSGFLALSPGTKLEMITGTGMTVDGGLYAFGTYTSPITVTGVNANPGVWNQVNIRNGGKAILQFCNLGYGGRGASPQLLISSSDVAIQNCRIHHSLGDGIQVNTNKKPALTYNQIENNNYGLRNSTPATVINAVYNWWGMPRAIPC